MIHPVQAFKRFRDYFGDLPICLILSIGDHNRKVDAYCLHLVSILVINKNMNIQKKVVQHTQQSMQPLPPPIPVPPPPSPPMGKITFPLKSKQIKL